jgi:hypothetical protein
MWLHSKLTRMQEWSFAPLPEMPPDIAWGLAVVLLWKA